MGFTVHWLGSKVDLSRISPHNDKKSSESAVAAWLEANEDSAVILEGFSDAVCGILFDGEHHRVVYCYCSMVLQMIRDSEMNYQDACEYIEYNTIASIPDKNGPMIIDQAINTSISILPPSDSVKDCAE